MKLGALLAGVSRLPKNFKIPFVTDIAPVGHIASELRLSVQCGEGEMTAGEMVDVCQDILQDAFYCRDGGCQLATEDTVLWVDRALSDVLSR